MRIVYRRCRYILVREPQKYDNKTSKDDINISFHKVGVEIVITQQKPVKNTRRRKRFRVGGPYYI